MGGLGIFLMGMIALTDGLHALAGDAIRSALMRFTRSPLSGAITGATSTAILQSSSATTVAAVGFVGAGLMSFPKALGIIFGANIGTTLKGWVIALIGFKLQLGILAMPLVLIGAILRLFAKKQLATIGYTIAGFGLIFVAITMLQQGMSGLQGIITPEDLPPDTIVGRLQLVGLGMLVTVITQSSSAGVATALTALYTGTINFPQAAALVIGMDIGTTVTAAIATIGGTVGARRTGYSHVIYNCFTGLGALILLTPYTKLWEAAGPGVLTDNAEIALVGFHTTFNLLGVIVILPFTHRFARFIEKVVGGKTPAYTEKLDDPLLKQPTLAINAVIATLPREIVALLGHVNFILGDTYKGKQVRLSELQSALDETHAYIDRIHLSAGNGEDWKRLIAIIHTLDHTQRLHERCEEEEDRASTAKAVVELSKERDLLISTINQVLVDIDNGRWQEAHSRAINASNSIHENVRPYRETVMAQIASGELDVPHGTYRLEAIRWLRRVTKHIARITQHYGEAVAATGIQAN